MSLESPVASEPDSLGDRELLEKHQDPTSFIRGHANSTTFTRQRPTNLHRNPTRTHRQSLLSPQSVDNLDTDETDTPDFAMTQSMYEPYGKKEQIEKLTQQNKLMSLIASEKAAYAAQKRKQKEMKQKAIEQKKKNEERQKTVEERRIRMLAEEEEKRKRLLNKTATKSYNLTTSFYGNMTQSIVVKHKSQTNSKFLTTRPMSSTGKIFGFGSSAPRYICDPIKQMRATPSNPSSLDMSRESLPLSRMCASQILGRSTIHENHFKSGKNIQTNISKSTANVSDINRLRNKNGRGSISNVHGNPVHPRIPRTTPKNIKNLNTAVKIDISTRKSPDSHSRSRNTLKEVTTPTKIRSVTVDRQLRSPSKPPSTKIMIQSNTSSYKSMANSDDNRIHSKEDQTLTAGNRSRLSVLKNHDESGPASGRKSEVRFINTAMISERIEEQSSDNGVISGNSNTKELTKEEYKERMNLKRKLAKEKKIKEEIERELEKAKDASDHGNEALTPVDTSITTESEISINILPKDKETEQPMNIQELEINSSHHDMAKADSGTEVIKESDEVELLVEKVQERENIMKDDHVKMKNDITIIPSIEISKGKENLAASSDDLDRLERKKRLESIMSRIKKTPSGSSENVGHHISTSTLQTMMDKGHLSGMSKTAAVLMRNANRSSELFSSNSDLQSATEAKTPSISMENVSQSDKNPVDDVSMSRGDCDGKADSPKDILPALETKSNIMQNLSANAEGSYFTSWKEKYSVSDSLDSENDNTEG